MIAPQVRDQLVRPGGRFARPRFIQGLSAKHGGRDLQASRLGRAAPRFPRVVQVDGRWEASRRRGPGAGGSITAPGMAAAAASEGWRGV
jgi:hypothetical protein